MCSDQNLKSLIYKSIHIFCFTLHYETDLEFPGVHPLPLEHIRKNIETWICFSLCSSNNGYKQTKPSPQADLHSIHERGLIVNCKILLTNHREWNLKEGDAIPKQRHLNGWLFSIFTLFIVSLRLSKHLVSVCKQVSIFHASYGQLWESASGKKAITNKFLVQHCTMLCNQFTLQPPATTFP